ncbi:hypothetical protein [Trebonia sp.]|uniref:hypothetical protein n=1 Tax=Trebonia sp. TaxID=2767075 RepID=UPI003BB20B02
MITTRSAKPPAASPEPTAPAHRHRLQDGPLRVLVGKTAPVYCTVIAVLAAVAAASLIFRGRSRPGTSL